MNIYSMFVTSQCKMRSKSVGSSATPYLRATFGGKERGTNAVMAA